MLSLRTRRNLCGSPFRQGGELQTVSSYVYAVLSGPPEAAAGGCCYTERWVMQVSSPVRERVLRDRRSLVCEQRTHTSRSKKDHMADIYQSAAPETLLHFQLVCEDFAYLRQPGDFDLHRGGLDETKTHRGQDTG